MSAKQKDEFKDFFPEDTEPTRRLSVAPDETSKDIDSPFLGFVKKDLDAEAALAAQKLLEDEPVRHELRHTALEVGPENAAHELESRKRKAEVEAASKERTKRQRRRKIITVGGKAAAWLAGGAAIVGGIAYQTNEILEQRSGENIEYIGEQPVVAMPGDTVDELVLEHVEGLTIDGEDNPDIDLRPISTHVVEDPRNAEAFTGADGVVSAGNLTAGEQIILPAGVTLRD